MIGHEKRPTTKQVVKSLIADDGWLGLYRGLGPRFFSMSAWGTSMILAYEYLSKTHAFCHLVLSSICSLNLLVVFCLVLSYFVILEDKFARITAMPRPTPDQKLQNYHMCRCLFNMENCGDSMSSLIDVPNLTVL